MRKIHKNMPVLFTPYNWQVVETSNNKENNRINETIFTVANGYLGVRGFFEEGYEQSEYSDRTTMINGIYEYFPYHHIWCRPGFPERYHSIVAETNPFDIETFIDGERLTSEAKKIDYKRTLNMLDGSVERSFRIITQSGKTVEFTFKRFAMQHDVHIVADKITVRADSLCHIKMVTKLMSPRSNTVSKPEIGGAGDDVYDFISANGDNGLSFVNYKTKVSGFDIACAAKDVIDENVSSNTEVLNGGIAKSYEVLCKELTLTRFVAYATIRDFKDFKEQVKTKVNSAANTGFEECLKESAKVIKLFWDNADIEIDSDTLVQQGIRFSMFQIFQSTGKDGITNISANGLTGTAYSGHTFWDTEMFMMPMYIYTYPEIAKKLLIYRYNILDKARERAKQMDDQGALFSWNSINGEECGHVFEAVTAQYHINNDVFFAIKRYFEATNDIDFIKDYGLEILLEISKCMAHRGSFIPTKDNKFCINVVCGPDEYNPIVDNNMYTNVLTQKQMYFTLDMVKLISEKYPIKYRELASKCAITDDELALWKKVADNMYIPYSKQLEMYMQDDNFIYKDPIDIENIPKEKLPLLTHMHPLNLWRYQVCKQADIVLLTFICSDYFTKEERKKIFDYYEPKTIHDSSLSASIHSIVACDIGYKEDAYGYLKQASRMDLDNVNSNTCYGLHAACMGASWMMIVNGYAGLRIFDDKMHFKPFIHSDWNSYKVKIRFKNSLISVMVDHEKTVYELLSGDEIELEHNGNTYLLKDKLLINEGI